MVAMLYRIQRHSSTANISGENFRRKDKSEAGQLATAGKTPRQ